jgi:hypothetical protein
MPTLPRLALALPLIAALGACTTWRPGPISAPGGNTFLEGPVRVTRTDGATVQLRHATISRDSIVGLERASPHARVAIPVAEVRRVEARRANRVGTAVVVAVPVIAAVAASGAFVVHTDPTIN